jgi:hypothetical protein
VQLVASRHATHVPFPVQMGVPAGQAWSVCTCPSSEQMRTIPFAQLADLATHLSHSSPWLSHKPGLQVSSNANAD